MRYIYSYYSSSTGDRPLYIGTTCNPVDRMRLHAENSIWYDFWNKSVLKVAPNNYFDCLDDEATEIKKNEPMFNIHSNPRQVLRICSQTTGNRLIPHNLNSHVYILRLRKNGTDIKVYGSRECPIEWATCEIYLMFGTLDEDFDEIIIERKFLSADRPYQEFSKRCNLVRDSFEQNSDTVARYLSHIAETCLKHTGRYDINALDSNTMSDILFAKFDVSNDIGKKKTNMGKFFKSISKGEYGSKGDYRLIDTEKKKKNLIIYSLKPCLTK